MKDFYEFTKSFNKNPRIASNEDFEIFKDLTQNHTCLDISKNISVPLDNYSGWARCLNTIVVGSSGTGKTRNFSLPIIKQMKSSMVIEEDSNSVLYNTSADYLKKNGINVLRLNLENPKESNHYNPLDLYREDGTIDTSMVENFVNIVSNHETLCTNIYAPIRDEFWKKAEYILLFASVYYLLENNNIPKTQKTPATLYNMLIKGKKFIEDINKYAKANEKSKTAEWFNTFNDVPEKTRNNVITALALRVNAFANKDFADMTTYDANPQNNICIENLAKEKTYIFVTIPTHATTSDLLIAQLFYSQAYYRLYRLGESRMQKNNSPSLPIHINFLYDDFAFMPVIPNLGMLLSTCRVYNISNRILIQSFDQLRQLRKIRSNENFDILLANTDIFMYLGSDIPGDKEIIQKICGYQNSNFRTRGKKRKNKYLVSLSDLNEIKASKVLIAIRDLPIFIDDKCDTAFSE